MDMNIITIDLNEYGRSGEIVMAAPSLRRMAWMKNQVGKHAKVTDHGMTDADIGDIEVLNVLAHVRTAPFNVDLQAFYNFGDELDAISPGNSVKLFDVMTQAVKCIDEEKNSPLDN